ncbi:MAG: methylated-DNA--[protein]-cysteine S-methyltransferase [Bacteroidota bacterium]
MLEIAHLSTDFGFFEIVVSSKGIQRLQRIAGDGQSTTPKSDLMKEVMQQLTDYFSSKRREFDLPLDWEGTSDFYQRVWQALLNVPYGHTTSYSAIAQEIGDLNAVRAVGLANKNNPIAIVVPCHRIIAKNGDLQGYFYGLDMKRRLLALENPMSFGEQGSLF